eukprot:gb/GECG01004548.1/.p1 GENE.gb/GECG01004548.1/~~gb/GECG01004548.1/.p1  ORF type:complete len:330 (+),score=41.68 gb/GECG01004548.1/:1-990(+)
MAESATVCVTGASGYIASELVRQLLEKGYTVKATVRDVNNPNKTDHLKKLEGAQERLTLKAANLLEPGSFKEAVAGCSIVFHTASPFFWDTNDPEKELLQPAVDGTKNVLETCAAEKSVKRVVLTSSVASAIFADKDQTHLYSDKDFSDETLMRERGMYYPLSKTLAEKAAWKFVETRQPQFDLVSINPALVIGPMLQPSLNTSSHRLLQYLDGSKEKIANSYIPIVDVRDVSRAHIAVAEKPESAGRYLLAPYSEHWAKIINILKEGDHPGVQKSKIPSTTEESDKKPFPTLLDNSKAEEELGITWTPLETSLKDHMASLHAHGYLRE